ncbi:MAG: hypothetical protein ACRDT2_00075 [Natronosporangium sp.]
MWELLLYPQLRLLSHRDLVVLLARYPVMGSWWREDTCRAFLHLVNELAPGGVAALIAGQPPEHWLALWQAIAPVLEEAAGAAATPVRTDAEGVVDAANSVLVLVGQGYLSDALVVGR